METATETAIQTRDSYKVSSSEANGRGTGQDRTEVDCGQWTVDTSADIWHME